MLVYRLLYFYLFYHIHNDFALCKATTDQFFHAFSLIIGLFWWKVAYHSYGIWSEACDNRLRALPRSAPWPTWRWQGQTSLLVQSHSVGECVWKRAPCLWLCTGQRALDKNAEFGRWSRHPWASSLQLPVGETKDVLCASRNRRNMLWCNRQFDASNIQCPASRSCPLIEHVKRFTLYDRVGITRSYTTETHLISWYRDLPRSMTISHYDSVIDIDVRWVSTVVITGATIFHGKGGVFFKEIETFM